MVDGIHEKHENWAPTKYNDSTVFYIIMPPFKEGGALLCTCQSVGRYVGLP